MTTSGDSKDRNPNHPKLPALRSVPAPRRPARKANTSLTKIVERRVGGMGNASQKLETANLEASKVDHQNLPKLPALRSAPAPERPSRETSGPSTEKVGQKTRREDDDQSKLGATSSEGSEHKKPKLPRLSAFRSVPATLNITEKATSVDTKKTEQSPAENGKAISNLGVKNSQCSDAAEPKLPKRPTLRAVSAIWRSKQKASTKNAVLKAANKDDVLPTRKASKSGGSRDSNQKLPEYPVLHSLPAPKRTPRSFCSSTTRNVKHDITGMGNNPTKPGLTNLGETQDENINLPKLPAPRSIRTVKGKIGRKRASIIKGAGQRNGGSILPSYQPDKLKQRSSRDGEQNHSKQSTPHSFPIARLLNGKTRASVTKKVAQKLFGSGNNLAQADPNTGDSTNEKPRHPKRPALRSVPAPRQLLRSQSALPSKRPEKKIPRKGSNLSKPLIHSIPTSPDSNQPQYEMKDENNGASLPKVNSDNISGLSRSHSHYAREVSIEKVTKPHGTAPARKGTGKGRGKKESPQAKKTIAKPKRGQMGAVRKTKKSRPRSSNVSTADYHLGKGSSLNESTPTKFASSKPHRGYLTSSDSSDSGASSESDGSYTSASSEENEKKDPGCRASGAGKGDMNAHNKQSQRAESSGENPGARKGIKTVVGSQDRRSTVISRRHLVSGTRIKSRASESMLTRPSKFAGLKRSSVANIGHTSGGIYNEEQEGRPTKRQRNVPQKALRNDFQSLSYAEQLKAAGQDISGGGCPVRRDSPESDEKE